MLRYIGICRVALDPSKKRKFNRGGGQGSYGGHWERNAGAVPSRIRRNRTTVATQDAVVEESVTLVGETMVQTAEAEVREGVMAITPPPPLRQDGQRMRGGGQKCLDGDRSA